jgi:hypothetical protein
VVAWLHSVDDASLFLSAVTRNVADFRALGVGVLNPFV